MEAFIKAILNASITASYIAVAVVVLRLLMKKAPKFITVLLWGLVALRLVLPVLPESRLSLIPNPNPITSVTRDDEAPPTTDKPDIIPPVADTDDNTQTTPPAGTAPDNDATIDKEQQVTSTPEKTSPWHIAFWVWVAGVGAMLIYAVISWRRVLATVKEAIPTEGRAWVCDGIPSPFILGVFRPRVYMPASLNEEDAVYVSAHENAHIKRGDHLWKPLGFLLLSLHWFNPVMWAAYILLCRDIELACDEKAINALGTEHKKPYSHALISCSAKGRLISACPLAFGEGGVKERVKTVLNYKKPAFWIIIVAVIACIAASVVFLTNPKTEPDDKEQTPYIDEALIGTWYGQDIENAGVKFVFAADGTGTHGYTPIAWAVKDGVLAFKPCVEYTGLESSIADKWASLLFYFEQDTSDNGTPFDSLHTSYEYTVKDGVLTLKSGELSDSGEYRQTAIYGGDSVLSQDWGWRVEGYFYGYIFNNIGGCSKTRFVDGAITVDEERYAWRTDADNGVLEILAADGSSVKYNYKCADDMLLLTNDKESLTLYPCKVNDNNTSESGNRWTLTRNVLKISGEGEMTAPPKWAVENPFIEKIVISRGITSICESAFKGYTALTEVVIPDTVTSIGSNAFYGCTSLVSVKLPDGIQLLNGDIFDGCTSLESVNLPLSLNEVTTPLFAGCPKLTSVSVPSGSARFYIRGYALYDNATLLFCNKGVTGEYVIPGGTQSISEGAFANCKYLTKIVFTDDISVIPSNAFNGCTYLAEFVMPDAIKSIGSYAFAGCENLKSVVLPDGVESIAGNMFDGCKNLEKLTLPAKLNSIHGSAFVTCMKLTNISVDSGNEHFYVEDGVLFYDDGQYVHLKFYPKNKKGDYTVSEKVSYISTGAFNNCRGLDKLIFAEGCTVSAIEDNMFYGCLGLYSISLNSHLKSVGNNPFKHCNSLGGIRYNGTMSEWNALDKHPYWYGEDALYISSVKCTNGTVYVGDKAKEWTLDDNGTFTLLADVSYSYLPLWEDDKDNIKTLIIKDGVTVIPKNAFSYCKSLTSVSIASSVTEIEAEAFAGCSSLKTVTGAVNVKSIGYNAFNGCGITDISFAKSVTSLGEAVFCVCANLKTAVLPVGIDNVPMHLFALSGVETVHIPKSVTAIHSLAFEGGSLKTIVYSGTAEEWSRITPDALWLGDAEDYTVTVKCTDGTITAENTKGPVTNDNPGPIHP